MPFCFMHQVDSLHSLVRPAIPQIAHASTSTRPAGTGLNFAIVLQFRIIRGKVERTNIQHRSTP